MTFYRVTNLAARKSSERPLNTSRTCGGSSPKMSRIANLRRQNAHLDRQIRALESAKASGNYSSAADILEENGLNDDASTLVSSQV